MRLACIHASDRLIQEDLETDEERAAFAKARMRAATSTPARAGGDAPVP